MIILQIEIDDGAFPQREGDAPIAGNADAPCAGAVASQSVNTPAWRPQDALCIRRQDQGGNHPPDSGLEIAAQFATIIVSNEAPKPSMAYRANSWQDVR